MSLSREEFTAFASGAQQPNGDDDWLASRPRERQQQQSRSSPTKRSLSRKSSGECSPLTLPPVPEAATPAPAPPPLPPMSLYEQLKASRSRSLRSHGRSQSEFNFSSVPLSLQTDSSHEHPLGSKQGGVYKSMISNVGSPRSPKSMVNDDFMSQLSLGNTQKHATRISGATRNKEGHRRSKTDMPPLSSIRGISKELSTGQTNSIAFSAQQNARRQLAFVLDIDGCLSNEGVPIPGSKEALHKLRSMKVPFCVCTNGGGQLESTRAARLSKTFGIDISPDQVILSHTPLRTEVVPRLKDDRVLIVGENCGEVARAYGLSRAEGVREYGQRHPSLFPRRREENAVPVDDADDPVRAILFFEDPEDLGEALQLCLDVLLTNGNPSGPRVLIDNEDATQEVEVWFTNPDLVYSGLAKHPRLTQGTYRQCLEAIFASATTSTSTSYYSSNKSRNATMNKGRVLDAKSVGKPTSLTGSTALSKLLGQCPPNTNARDLDIWTVGDNPYSDTALAHAMGWKSALVRTGIWNGEVVDLAKEGVMPSKVADSFEFVLKELLPE